MDHFSDDEAYFTIERNNLIAYFMTFAIKSIQIIQDHDSEALFEICTRCADEIYAYRSGKPLPESPGEPEKPENNGWRLV